LEIEGLNNLMNNMDYDSVLDVETSEAEALDYWYSEECASS